ncbi:hypothetical protein C1645_753340 [Glomus cerebriforme]|uniref:Uncharacterized protein n=1 Tax=Glomus cerebriforme TaxID=658196 RepID=A0A397TJK8_9GLOM|nr:hypothetical protein C1645_753340 [Glomus cerebriforme]
MRVICFVFLKLFILNQISGSFRYLFLYCLFDLQNHLIFFYLFERLNFYPIVFCF